MSFRSEGVLADLSESEASALSRYLQGYRNGVFGDLDLHTALLGYLPIMSDDEGADFVRMSETEPDVWDALQKLLRSLVKQRREGSRCPLSKLADEPVPRWLAEWAEEVSAGMRRKPGTGRGRTRTNRVRDARIVDVAMHLMHRKGFDESQALKWIASHLCSVCNVTEVAIKQAFRRQLKELQK